MTAIKKFVAIGPESTGKSTLCEILASRYDTYWCPEYARQYLTTNGNAYTYNDLLTIAKGHVRLEEETIQKAVLEGKQMVFIDTDMYVMKVWCEYVFQKCHAFILDKLAERKYDGYFLCHPDLPWKEDPLREYPQQEIRQQLFNIYQELLMAQNTPWCPISGDSGERLLQAEKFVNSIVTNA